MGIKILLLLLFFGSMIAIGLYSRKHASSVAGFVLGGRNVGPWLTAFAYGTSYFSAVVFVGYAGMGNSGTKNASYDQIFACCNHAGFLWKTF